VAYIGLHQLIRSISPVFLTWTAKQNGQTLKRQEATQSIGFGITGLDRISDAIVLCAFSVDNRGLNIIGQELNLDDPIGGANVEAYNIL
jgi:hypothetical protein